MKEYAFTFKEYSDGLKKKDLISLGIGEPGFNTIPSAKEGGKRAIDENSTRYTAIAGIPELREAIAEAASKTRSLEFKGDEVLTAPGVRAAMAAAIFSVVDPGDEVLVLDPSWSCVTELVNLAGGKVSSVELKERDRFRVRPSDIEGRVTRRTKLISINTPNNPTGSVYTKEELEGVARIAVKHDLTVLSDEIYEVFTYDGRRHISIASLPGMKERTIVAGGATKVFGMSGWRLGYILAPEEVIRLAECLACNLWSCAPAVSQHATYAALKGPQDYVEEKVRELEAKRDLTCQRLDRMQGLSYVKPEGAYYVWLNVGKYGEGESLAKFLVDEYGVVVLPGIGFGECGRDHVRISYTVPPEKIEEAMNRIEAGLESLRGKPELLEAYA